MSEAGLNARYSNLPPSADVVGVEALATPLNAAPMELKIPILDDFGLASQSASAAHSVTRARRSALR